MSENKTILTTRRFELWWRKAQAWFATQFASIKVDLTPVEEKVDEVKSDVADVKTAVEHIDFSTLAKQGTDQTATLTAIKELLAGGEDPDIPEGVAERLAMILEHFGIKTISGYSFGTPTEIIDELKDIIGTIDQEATLPNSVTIDGTTYSGTSNS